MIEHRQALLRLLNDDDPTTLDLVKKQLSLGGVAGLPELRSLLLSAGPLAAKHLRDVIAEIEEREAEALFAQLCAEFTNASDLEAAVWRLAVTLCPGEDFSLERGKLDAWGAEVARRLPKARNALDRVETLAEFLSHEIHLRGNTEDYYNIENSLLPRVIATGLGIPISLCLIYMFVGRRAGLQVDGVGLPGHFLVRHEEIFFDPFHDGRRVGLDECRALMKHQNLVLKPEHLIAATAQQILLRLLTNIFYCAERSDPAMAAKVSDWIERLRPQG